VAATQNGIVSPPASRPTSERSGTDVTPFAMKRASRSVPWAEADLGTVPKVGPAMKGWLVDVIRKESYVDPSDGATNRPLSRRLCHNSLGANDGKGWKANPVTGQPYPPDRPSCGLRRVMAEFWADGPNSETPPGHWNVLANYVSDSPGFPRRLFGKGELSTRSRGRARLSRAERRPARRGDRGVGRQASLT